MVKKASKKVTKEVSNGFMTWKELQNFYKVLNEVKAKDCASIKWKYAAAKNFKAITQELEFFEEGIQKLQQYNIAVMKLYIKFAERKDGKFVDAINENETWAPNFDNFNVNDERLKYSDEAKKALESELNKLVENNKELVDTKETLIKDYLSALDEEIPEDVANKIFKVSINELPDFFTSEQIGLIMPMIQE